MDITLFHKRLMPLNAFSGVYLDAGPSLHKFIGILYALLDAGSGQCELHAQLGIFSATEGGRMRSVGQSPFDVS
jgi:hypothetical protein